MLVQTVAGSVGTMPLGLRLRRRSPRPRIPAQSRLKPPPPPPRTRISSPRLRRRKLQGGLRLPLGKLILWALGLCFFGVMFAVPLAQGGDCAREAALPERDGDGVDDWGAAWGREDGGGRGGGGAG